MITDEMLRDALTQSDERYMEWIEKEYGSAPTHVFSRRYERKINRLKRRAAHPDFYRVGRRVAALFLVMIALAGVLLASSSDVSASTPGWIKGTYRDSYYVFRYEDETADTSGNKDYCLGFIPEGYSPYKVIEVDGGCNYLYINDAGQYLRLSYLWKTSESVWFTSMRNTTHYSETVNGWPADYFESNDPRIASVILWVDEDNGNALSVNGFFSREELIELAESVTPQE